MEVFLVTSSGSDYFIDMEKVWEKFDSHEEADKADDDYYRALSPDERVNMLLELVRRHGHFFGEPTEGFARVFRVVTLEES